ncbi:hypothetical protein [Halobacillus karajensis]|uniref:hypothetical protein n=3 Tax=Halobacillus karajensis TaxID=195088 RepID=UPI00068A41B8
MRIQNRMPKTNAKTHLHLIENGWVPMKEPKSLSAAMIFSIPFMILNGRMTIGAIHIFSSISFNEFGLPSHSISITLHSKNMDRTYDI